MTHAVPFLLRAFAVQANNAENRLMTVMYLSLAKLSNVPTFSRYSSVSPVLPMWLGSQWRC
jgi:hypothetical protein